MEEVEGVMIDNEVLLGVLLHQRENRIDDSVYKMVQCDFAYNSNHMEGSRLTSEQTRMVFGRKEISGEGIPLDDILEAMNHFEAFDTILDRSGDPLDADLLRSLHGTLKAGTTQARNPLYSVGDYKKYENVVGALDLSTTPPEKVEAEMEALLRGYERTGKHDLDDVLSFHVAFERIHPFSDGNGRIGRLIMFKECLRNGIVPFIITDDLHAFYIRGLQNFHEERGWLRDTCLTAQDRFIERYLPLAESYAKAMDAVRLEKPIDLEQECGDCRDASRDSDLNRGGGQNRPSLER